MVTYVVCKYRDLLFKSCLLPFLKNQCNKFGAELIIIEHAHSIFSAYESGRKLAKNEIIAYIHDDVEILNSNITLNLVNEFKNKKKLGLLGVVGAVTGEFIPWWNNEVLAGHFLCPDRSFLRYLAKQPSYIYINATNKGVLSSKRVHIPKVDFDVWTNIPENNKWIGTYQSSFIDGAFMVERQNGIPWDTETFHGWHCYDLDRSLQIRDAGMYVEIADFLIFHNLQPHKKWWMLNHEKNLQLLQNKWCLNRISNLTHWYKTRFNSTFLGKDI